MSHFRLLRLKMVKARKLHPSCLGPKRPELPAMANASSPMKSGYEFFALWECFLFICRLLRGYFSDTLKLQR